MESPVGALSSTPPRDSKKAGYSVLLFGPPIGTNNSKRPIPNPKAQGSDPLVHRDPESELVAPAIVIGPKDTTVVAGSEATLECIANARPLDVLVVSWKRDGRRLASGRHLIIPAPASSDTGSYVCEASLSNSTAKPVEARAHLTVIGHIDRNPALQ
ncbi:hypothetical protein L3Q82_005433 [Scortum barcoo]|uniref:Uncharacterized protein n=1 Tax=Scortum barcoo TaxID=214431 RepID=A0ACB8VB65_9TELE|nr:hypothetical protein L3Q82_005433 [Scortum barcoo]